MSLFFKVIDFNAKDTTHHDTFDVIPPDMDAYNRASVTSNNKYGIMKDVSTIFKHRKLNMVYIEDVSEDEKDSYQKLYNHQENLLNSIQDILEIYQAQRNAIILTNVLDVEGDDLSNDLEFIGFTSLDGLLKNQSSKLMIYINDLVGVRFFELGHNIWS